MRFLLLIVTTGILLLGCGGDSAQQTALKYTQAIENADWKQACSLIDEESRNNGEILYQNKCEEWLKDQVSVWLELETEIEISTLETSADYASFQTSVSDSPLLLRQTEDGWRITFFGKE